MQVSATRFRVPDVAILDFDRPPGQVVTHPPIAVFEVLSPEDTVRKLRRKLDDYAKNVRALSIAVTTAFALLTDSSNSFSGMESATIPAPAWM